MWLYCEAPMERERFRVVPLPEPHLMRPGAVRILVFCGKLEELKSDPLADRRFARWDCAHSIPEAEEKIRRFMREGINNPFCD